MSDNTTNALSASLTPSQALNSSAAAWQPSSTNSNNANSSGKKKNNRRRRKANKAKDDDTKLADPGTSRDKNADKTKTDDAAPADPGSRNQQGQSGSKNAKNNKGKRNRNNKNGRRRYPWRRFIPNGTVDPITLDNLNSLEYPPFALVATKPYTPVPVWPIPDPSTCGKKGTPKKAESVEEINRKRLQEQWGQVVVGADNAAEDAEEDSNTPIEKRHLHLYDGRALAYYLVSQLQFIDPLNRRDLTRPELVNLDSYLKRHGFNDLRVTEAYDAKGITISSAGAAASTAEGRAEILQQIAANLLNTLFGNRSATAGATPAPETSLQEQYSAMRRQEEQTRHRQEQHEQQQWNNQAYINPFGDGYYASADGGLMVIDDDENPGLRGDGYAQAAGMTQPHMGNGAAQQSHPFYSASHIAQRYGEGRSGGTADDFPTLSEVAPSPVARPPPPAQPKAARKSKTLSRITGAVKKTDPDEVQKQWEAREEARRRAILSNLSLGVDTSGHRGVMQALPRPPPGLLSSQPTVVASEGQLSRNQVLADALGVQPATVRKQFSSGWARPTNSQLSLDEFGDELNAAIYPESLIIEATERIPFLLKLEKKWKTFLSDDTAASLPLNAMDRPARKFTHEYSDFWNLRTESFDPEPKRYIHCMKMENTNMPHPLLSDVARNWRGPLSHAMRTESDHAVQQTAGQSTRSIAYHSEQRMPLSLKPRFIPEGEQRDFQPVKTDKDMLSEEEQISSRFDSLSSNRERPKLELAKRTVPLELPPFQTQQAFNLAEDMKRSQERAEEKKRKDREAAARQTKALEDAFASDDENEGQGSDEEWHEALPVYTGSDSEE